MSRRPGLRTWSLAVVASLALVALLGAAGSASAGSPAQAAAACSTPRYPGSGYFTSLNVRGVSCRFGRSFIVRYYRCRVAHGKAGRCTRRIDGYRCSERRVRVPTELDARVTCTRGSRRVVHTYQQNL